MAGFAVVKLQEAMALRDAGVKKPVLLMGPVDAADLADLHRRDIMPMVYTPIGDALARAAAATGTTVSTSTSASTPASAASACRTARPTRSSAIWPAARACGSTA